MKKHLVIITALMILFTSCVNQKGINNVAPVEVKPVESSQVPELQTSQDPKMNAPRLIALNYDKPLGEKIDGFNTVVLNVDGVRIAKKPYRTNNTILRNIDRSVGEMEAMEIGYYLSLKSGPGLSGDGSVSTLFTNKNEAHYFAQMVREIALRYEDEEHFRGIMLDIGAPDVVEDDYYETISYIVNRVQSEVEGIDLIVNLHPLAFETGFFNPEELGLNDVTFNLEIHFKSISYPGYAQGHRSANGIDKNVILKKLQPYMEWASENDRKLTVSVEAPWVEKTEILLQDMFELSKMLKFDYIICSGNSEDMYDIRRNDSVLKVIKRQSM